MTLDATEAKRLEAVLVSTVLENPTAKFGPNVCTCLAYAPEFWESVEARIVADGINKVRKTRPTHPVVVKQHVPPECMDWLDHPMFKDALPLSCIEHEVFPLIERYHSKRIVNTIAKAYQQLIDKPELAREVALDLRLKLESIL